MVVCNAVEVLIGGISVVLVIVVVWVCVVVVTVVVGAAWVNLVQIKIIK